jgi:putative glutamine amidotransferase
VARRPLIGLTTYRERARTLVWDTEFALLLPNVYVDAVARAGGIPVLLPPQEHGAAEVAARLDALVLSGGSDIAPEQAGPAYDAINPATEEEPLFIATGSRDTGI